jgi:hypothetical protein
VATAFQFVRYYNLSSLLLPPIIEIHHVEDMTNDVTTIYHCTTLLRRHRQTWYRRIRLMPAVCQNQQQVALSFNGRDEQRL